jgi:hypothetical protein
MEVVAKPACFACGLEVSCDLETFENGDGKFRPTRTSCGAEGAFGLGLL